MTKKIACIQSNYIPWKGYFDIINMADEFVLYDDVQYTKNDWRNRNKIKTKDGLQWLTIPIKISRNFGQLIKDAEVVNLDWAKKHWLTLAQNYRKAPYFHEFEEQFYSLFQQCSNETHLSKINYSFLTKICEILEIKTSLTWSMDYQLSEKDPNKRLIEICKKANASIYISGPAAKSYLDLDLWQRENITIEFVSYDGYVEYPQLFPPFDHYVSVLDLLFNVGRESKKYLISNRQGMDY